MELKYKDMIRALNAIEDERKIPEEVVLEALKEAMAKAYKKDAELPDINVVAEINDKKQTIDIFQLYNVVEAVEDYELEMDLEEARSYKRDAILGDVVKMPVEITTMSRAAATLAKSVMKQKIREAEKVAVYDAYIDQLYDMVIGIVESVKDKFTLINLGKTTALMPKSSQIPGERLYEGQKIRVIIKEVNKDSKGSQVLVSRSDEMLVRRLFEKEVPEINQGIVEIKALAREAGERTKMAVFSYNSEVDPIGACIGQRGGRVQEIIDELKGEKIDIFEWSDDITVLVKNALAPADVEAVIPNEDGKSLLVVVSPEQLSLAIGKKGKNARLAVKLTGRKIDIKTRAEIEEMGMDYDQLIVDAEARRAELLRESNRKQLERLEAEAKEAEEKRKAAVEEQMRKSSEEAKAAAMQEDILPAEMQEHVSDRILDEMAYEPESAEENVSEAQVDTTAEDTVVDEVPAAEKPVAAKEPVKVEVKPVDKKTPKEPKMKKADLEEIASKNDYVSVFEKLANTSKPKQSAPAKKKYKKSSDDEGIKVRNDELLKQLSKNVNTDIKPVYTEEELEEIERQQQEEEDSRYDIDYDEYEDYYNE